MNHTHTVPPDVKRAQQDAWLRGKAAQVRVAPRVIGYRSKTMDAFARRFEECEALIAAAYVIKDPKTGVIIGRKNPTKEERAPLRAAMIDLVSELEKLSPTKLIGMIAADKTILQGPKLSARLHALDSLSQALSSDVVDKIIADAPHVNGKPRNKRERERIGRIVRDVLLQQSSVEAEGLVAGMKTMRTSVKPTRERVWVLNSVNPEADIPLAKAFVEAVTHDRDPADNVLAYLPELDRIARKTAGFLALLDYSNEVKAVAQELLEHPDSLYERKFAQLASRLDRASATFKEVTHKQQPTTVKPFQIFKEQDGIIHDAAAEMARAPDYKHAQEYATTIKIASEYLNNLSLTYLKGGPAAQKQWVDLGEHRIDDSLDIPKLQTRIAHAYIKDRELTVRRMKVHQSGLDNRTIPESMPFVNPIRDQSATMDVVYLARFLAVMQKTEDMLKNHFATMADLTIGTDKASTPKTQVQGPKSHGRTRKAAQTEGAGTEAVSPEKALSYRPDLFGMVALVEKGRSRGAKGKGGRSGGED